MPWNVLTVTGTVSEECMMLNELPVGPRGKNGVVWVSEPMIHVPSSLCAVVITRGGERVLDAIMLCQKGDCILVGVSRGLSGRSI